MFWQQHNENKHTQHHWAGRTEKICLLSEEVKFCCQTLSDGLLTGQETQLELIQPKTLF